MLPVILNMLSVKRFNHSKHVVTHRLCQSHLRCQSSTCCQSPSLSHYAVSPTQDVVMYVRLSNNVSHSHHTVSHKNIRQSQHSPFVHTFSTIYVCTIKSMSKPFVNYQTIYNGIKIYNLQWNNNSRSWHIYTDRDVTKGEENINLSL